jgi:hypothetical protein
VIEHSKYDIGNIKEFAYRSSRILESTMKGFGREELDRGLGGFRG